MQQVIEAAIGGFERARKMRVQERMDVLFSAGQSLEEQYEDFACTIPLERIKTIKVSSAASRSES